MVSYKFSYINNPINYINFDIYIQEITLFRIKCHKNNGKTHFSLYFYTFDDIIILFFAIFIEEILFKLFLVRSVIMKKNIEIRWHGRGGQGAKTAALLLADVAFNTGMYVQGFPEYGPERMGAPITAYNRIGNSPIRVHSNIYNPDFVVVVDETLLHSVDVTNGLSEDGAIVINTTKEKSEIIPLLNGYKGSVYVIDARKVSMATLGKYFPNSPMLASIVKVANIMDEQVFLSQMEASYRHKFAKKPEVIEGNMNALKMAFQEVK